METYRPYEVGHDHDSVYVGIEDNVDYQWHAVRLSRQQAIEFASQIITSAHRIRRVT